MSKKIVFSAFGPMVSTKEVGQEMLTIIEAALIKEENIQIDLEGIRSMATFCAKQVFGSLYISLGAENFFDKIEILNATNDLKTIIKIGINSALEDNAS